MITVTVRNPAGRTVATWTSSGEEATGDPLFLDLAANWIPEPGAYYPYPEMTAIIETAKAVGFSVTSEGEEDPLPPGAVQ